MLDLNLCCTYVVPIKKPTRDGRLKACPGSDLNRYDRCGSQDFKSCVSTNFTTGAAKKNPPFRMDSLSGRPGSNRPPRPWQGRALPNELLPQGYFNLSQTREGLFIRTFFWTAKIRVVKQTTQTYLYFGLYKVFSGTFTSGCPLYRWLYKL